MKYLKLILSALLLSFVFSFSVNAQALPTMSNPTFQLVQNGQNNLVTSPFFSYGVAPFYNGLDVLDSFLGDVSLKSEDFVIRPLSEIEKENLSEDFQRHFYDIDGNEISIDDLYYCYANNGYNKCELYMDINGNALYEDPNHTNVLLNIGFVDNLSNNDWSTIYSNLSSRIKNGNLNYYPDLENIPNNPNTYFIWVGLTAGGVPNRAGWLLIQNQWIPGKIQPKDNSGVIYQWYCNDLDLLQWGSTLGTYKVFTTQSGTYNVSGYTYRYLVTADNLTHSGDLADYDDWIAGRTYNRVFARQGLTYANLSSPENSIGFKKVVIPEVPLIDFDELYSYDELQNLQPQGNQVPIVNPDFNPNSNISEQNYPFTYPSPIDAAVPSTLPLPGSNPNISPDPGLSLEDILNPGNDPVLPDNIPFISNLETRFPFSIPWDIKRILQSLQSSAVAPSFEISWYIAPINYTWEFSLDLSEFSTIASIFRTLFLISFIIGLAIFSYNHFFGS